MLPSPIRYYQNLSVVKPDWPVFKKVVFAVRSILSMIFQRIVTMAYLLFGIFPFQVKIHNQEVLDKAVKNGAVFLGVHSGSYPILGKVIHDLYPGKEVVVTFYHKNKISFFPIFKKLFKKLGFTIVALGGAMKTIDPILKAGGSMTLFLDARLPVPEDRTVKVKMFGIDRQLSTGPYFLANKYDLAVVPIYVKRSGLTLNVMILPELKHKQVDQQTFMKNVAQAVEVMVKDTLKSWQTYDTFLLDE
jgi:lauroyl/myristoyl acyltransferase